MRGYIYLLVFGLIGILRAEVHNDNIESETKDIAFKSAAFNSPLELDKIKRGAAKLTNADAPSFNHLSSTSSANSNAGFKQSVMQNVPPFRFIPTNQYQPFVTYLQPSHTAAQIAAQYSFQGQTPLSNFVQTPTQIQFVATPTVAHLPFVKYQSFGGDASYRANSGSDAASNAAPGQYSAQSSQNLNTAHVASSVAATLNSQPKDFAVYHQSQQVTRPVYYSQQPFVTFFLQPQTGPANYLYQQPGFNYFVRPQQYDFYGANRFGVIPLMQPSPVTYLLPTQVQSNPQSESAVNNLKSTTATKIQANSHSSPSVQSSSTSSSSSASSTSFNYGNKS